MYAAFSNPNPAMTTTLLKVGAEVNAGAGARGLTPLVEAAANNQNPEVVTALLNAGADAKAKDGAGKTAFDYAQSNEKLKGTDAYRKLNEGRY